MYRLVLILCLLMLSFTARADNIIVTGMRISPAANKTIIVFDLSGKTTGKVKFIPESNTLVLTFENARLRFQVRHARLKGSNITEFSAKELPDNSVEFDFTPVGNVKWTTDFIEDSTGHQQMRFEVNSVAPQKKTKEPQAQKHDAVFKQAVINDLDLVGRSRWENPKSTVNKNHIFTVVIDPGHGGKDTGAIGKSGIREKDIVLMIAKKLVAELRTLPGIRVVMTRDRDYYVSLRGRLGLARQHDADLFIAVHADAYLNNNRATGASVYALSQHGATSEAARWLLKQEKYSELDDIDFDNLPDRSLMVRSVLIDLSQTATIRDSLRLGNKVLGALDNVSALHHNHVEQAPFCVLKSPDIPSILVETGFITNPSEEQLLVDPGYQDKLARAIAGGVKSYMKKYASQATM